MGERTGGLEISLHSRPLRHNSQASELGHVAFADLTANVKLGTVRLTRILNKSMLLGFLVYLDKTRILEKSFGCRRFHETQCVHMRMEKKPRAVSPHVRFPPPSSYDEN